VQTVVYPGKLIEASILLHGPYLDGRDKQIEYTNEVIRGYKPRSLRSSFNVVYNGMEARKRLQRPPESVMHAGLSLLDEHELSVDFVARVALSQLDPGLMLHAGRRERKLMAGILTLSRLVVLDIHEAEVELSAPE
jgi:hypothetical protein